MKIGFLGAGAMGGAILSGAVKTGVVKAEDVYVSDFSNAIKAKYKEMGCHIADSNEELGKSVDILVACVKPQYAAAALSELLCGGGEAQAGACGDGVFGRDQYGAGCGAGDWAAPGI